MAYKKKAKILKKNQITMLLKACDHTRYPLKNKMIVLLSFKAGLRSLEIANLKWEHVTDPEGNLDSSIYLDDRQTKGKSSGRVIPMHPDIKEHLLKLQQEQQDEFKPQYIIRSERGHRMSAASITVWFSKFYKNLGLEGCSSHSGRRTFITELANKCYQAGGCIDDVKTMAGHKHLATTLEYIEPNKEAKIKMINMI